MILLKMCKIMEILVLLSLILATSAAPNIQPLQKTEEARVATNSEYRLASTVQPVSYDINLVIPQQALAEGNNTSYSGSVNINTTVTQAANTILIHSLVYIENILVEMDIGNATVQNITNVTVSWSGNNETEITTIVLPNNLTVGTVCLLHIDFIGSLDAVNMEGFYRSEYETNGTKEFLATTQFQPTHARMAFPCFDEPQYKAVFTLTLTYPSGYVARANTPEISSTIEPPGTSGTITTSFQQTPRMSTYLLAFTISKFDCTANSSIASGTTVGVCSRADFADDRNFSAEYGKTILNAMNQWTTLDYNTSGINKLDQFAIPDFSAGAMENWGLVTYREFLLLYNGLDTSNDFKQQILTVIAHEIAHMWFGNLVTTEWWDTLFLNEGFATYFSYFILNEIPELANYEMNKQFVIDAQQLALSQDATLSSPTLSAEAWTPTQIWNKFNVLTYYKGASIFRMIENLMGTTNFKEGLIEFLTSNQYGAVTPAVLWDTLSRYANVSLLPPNISLATVASTWTDQPGFPVVNATLIDGAVILTQERFLNTLNSDNASYQWYIPITFRLIDSDTTSTTWLLANNETVINMESNNTIILNYNAEGFYRVYYDAALREKIVSTLLSNHTLISDITRAQIIDDALTFAQANILNHSESFKFLNYLTNETSYYPWYSAIKGLNYIFLRLGRESAMTQRVNDLLLSLMQNVYPNISGTNWENQMESLRTTLLWSTACQAGHTSCIEEARSLFDAFRENNTGINSNIRTTVYCTALRYSNDSERDFNFLLNRLLTVDQPHETLYLLQSLGCTTNRTLLFKYLEESIRSNSSIRLQDITTVWSSVYTSSSQGADVAFDYFIENYPAIISHYRDGRMLLPAIVSRFTQYNQIIKLLNFISQLPENDTLRLIAEASSILAVQNLGHQEIISRDLENHFNSENETPVDPSITTTTSSAAIYGLSFVALLFSLIVIYYP